MRHPPWIKSKAPAGPEYEEVKSLVGSARLHTVCQSANCPNIGECWRERTATFMILGDVCTRNCRFCAIKHAGNGAGMAYPGPTLEEPGATLNAVDEDEPRRVADAVKRLGLKHAVITSVTRDDLTDGGAGIFAETVRAIHEVVPGCSVEVLIPDFQGSQEALRRVIESGPEILNHNVETVERCYPLMRPQADYRRSIELLAAAKRIDPRMRTKSGLMVGAGETWEEVIQTMRDLRSADCDVLTIGQYLAPSPGHVPIARYYTPDEFSQLRQIGLDLGFGYVESGPLVRSSYHAARAR